MTEGNKLKLQFRNAGALLEEVDIGFESAGFSVQHSRIRLPAEYDFSWDGGRHYLAHHDLVLLDGEMEVGGEKPEPGRDIRDLMTFVPAGQLIKGWARPADRINVFTVVNFDPDQMESELQAAFNGFEPRAHIYFHEEELGTTMRKLGRLLASNGRPASRILVETLGLTAVIEMCRISMTGRESGKVGSPGQLGNAKRKLVQAYIEDNLAKDIGLDELAAVCGLTRFHFCRAFKATFGAPPYQYVSQRRIEKAKQMLATTGLPVSDVANACGFNGASQFGRAFRGQVGLTPLAFRKAT
jgi:AraC family transcriptional regulator